MSHVLHQARIPVLRRQRHHLVLLRGTLPQVVQIYVLHAEVWGNVILVTVLVNALITCLARVPTTQKLAGFVEAVDHVLDVTGPEGASTL